MEAMLENEFSLPFLVGNRPNEFTVADIENSQEIIKELLQKNCHLIIQIPMLPVYKPLLESNVIAENVFF